MLKSVFRFTVLGVLGLMWSAPGHAVLTIKITRGIEGALPIAVVPFAWEGGGKRAPVDVAAEKGYLVFRRRAAKRGRRWRFWRPARSKAH